MTVASERSGARISLWPGVLGLALLSSCDAAPGPTFTEPPTPPRAPAPGIAMPWQTLERFAHPTGLAFTPDGPVRLDGQGVETPDGAWTTDGWAEAAAWCGGALWIADGLGGLLRLDPAGPRPAHVGRIVDVACVRDDRLLVLDAHGRLSLLATRAPTEPVDEVTLSGPAHRLAAHGERFAVALRRGGGLHGRVVDDRLEICAHPELHEVVAVGASASALAFATTLETVHLLPDEGDHAWHRLVGAPRFVDGLVEHAGRWWLHAGGALFSTDGATTPREVSGPGAKVVGLASHRGALWALDERGALHRHDGEWRVDRPARHSLADVAQAVAPSWLLTTRRVLPTSEGVALPDRETAGADGPGWIDIGSAIHGHDEHGGDLLIGAKAGAWRVTPAGQATLLDARQTSSVLGGADGQIFGLEAETIWTLKMPGGEPRPLHSRAEPLCVRAATLYRAPGRLVLACRLSGSFWTDAHRPEPRGWRPTAGTIVGLARLPGGWLVGGDRVGLEHIPDDGPRTLLPFDALTPRIAHDPRWLAVAAGERGVLLLDTPTEPGAPPHPVALLDTPGRAVDVAWTPNGDLRVADTSAFLQLRRAVLDVAAR